MKRLFLFFAFVCLASTAHAQILLKQSTATTVNFKLTTIATGADNTAATVTSITIKLAKQSDTSSATVTAITCAASGSANDCLHIAGGLWNLELTSANTDTLGRFDVCALYTGDYTDCTRYEVVNAGWYDVAVTTGPGLVSTITAILGTPAGASLAADIATRSTPAVKRAVGFQWGIQMVTSAGTLVTTGTPVCTRAIDSPTFAATTNSPSALTADGFTELTLSNADMTGTDYVILKCTVATARNYYTIFKLQAP